MRDRLDDLLDRYAPEAGALWLSALPEQVPEHGFSPKFRRKVEKLLRRQRRSPAVNSALRYGRRAAAFALVFLTLAFSCLMTVDAAFRERVIRAVVQVYQDFTEFVYTSDSPAGGKPGDLVFTYLPEGMEEVKEYREESDLHAYFCFENGSGDVLSLEQVKIDQNTSDTYLLDMENADTIKCTIHGVPAIGVEKGLGKVLHWTEGNFVYTLSGTISMDKLRLIAEGIQLSG